jgi:menaquinone-9 beta-reductase
MFDVAIIGAGLAGSSAAISLARLGYKVRLMEAGRYPRPKVCGEFLSPEASVIMDDLACLDTLRNLKPVRIDKLRITAPNGIEWQSLLPFPAMGISRFALDKALVDCAVEAGVEFREACRVSQIEGQLKDGYSLTCQTEHGKEIFRAAAIIAAHGKRSNLDKLLKRDSQVEGTKFIGLKQHFRGVNPGNQIELHVFKGGYCGISQVEDGTSNVCLLVREDTFQEASSATHKIEHFIEWTAQQNPHLRDFLSQAIPVYPDWLSIAQVSLISKDPIEDDILLAGDSVGMIAPLAGDGMAMALQSGRLAAFALDKFFYNSENAETMKENYRNLWQSSFSQRLRLGRLIQAVMLEPALLSPALQVLNVFPILGDFLVRQTRDLAALESDYAQR